MAAELLRYAQPVRTSVHLTADSPARDVPVSPTAPTWRTQLIEAYAGRIDDPIERLKFLRRISPKPPDRPSHSKATRRAALALLAAVAILLLLLTSIARTADGPARPQPRRLARERAVEAKPVGVWLVEQSPDFEIYSNGLRVEHDFLSASRPRTGRALKRNRAGTLEPAQLAVPAGIVFHSSESEVAPFDPTHNEAVKRQGRGLLEYVRNGRLYNFLIDRFGRVHRILEDSQKANHAGHSVWADSDRIYINLNETFLGISFEARRENDSQSGVLSHAQLHSGRILTEMLRSSYGIAAGNCVTHAQVSVNPANFRIGYHTDWAANFPFIGFGLPNTYDQPLPSVYLFGFTYDPGYVSLADPVLQEALRLADEQVHQTANHNNVSVTACRNALRGQYERAIRRVGANQWLHVAGQES